MKKPIVSIEFVGNGVIFIGRSGEKPRMYNLEGSIEDLYQPKFHRLERGIRMLRGLMERRLREMTK